MSKQILICNTIFTSDSGKPQAVACRMRGEVNGKTYKVSPHLFGNDLPLPGEAVYCEFDESKVRESGNYKILSNAKVFSVGVAPSEAHQAAEPEKEAVAETEPPF